jgi:hypothetical protein
MKMYKGVILILFAIFACQTTFAQDLKNANGYVQMFEVSAKIPTTNDKFFYENDTIKVTYYFWGNRGIMQISIFNKKDFPIYIDWNKSIMQVNTDKLIYAYEANLTPDNAKLYKAYLHEGRNLSSMDYEAQYQMGSTDKKKVETVTEVKAKGFYMSLRYHITSTYSYKFDDNATAVSETRSDNSRETTDVYQAAFDSTNSPLKFSSKLTYSTNKDFVTEKVISNSFWVSKVKEMDAKHFMGEKVGKTPEGFPIFKYPSRKSTHFYVEIEKKNSIVFKKSKATK